MKSIITWGLSLFFSIAFSAGFAQGESPVTAESAFNKSEITIGDKVQYSIIVEIPKGAEIEFTVLDLTLTSQGFAVKDFGEDKPVKISGKRIRKKYWYLLNTYITGSYTIPPVTIKYTLPDGTGDSVETQEVFLEVKSVIKEGEEPSDIRDIKTPVEIKVNYKKIITWTVIILALVLCLVTGIYLYIKYRHVIKSPSPPLPPHVIALRDLDKIRGMPLENGKQIKEYYISVSGIVRHYIENRFGFRAPEQTTEEFLASLTVTDNLSQNNKTLLRDFLRHCDMVKFAKYGPTKEEIDGVYDTARRFVEETAMAGNSL